MKTKSAVSKRIKATFRLDPENVEMLEQERLKRIGAGVPRSDADLSDLVNECITRAFGKASKRRTS